MRKIAVVFQGVGYTKDRPLLYYAGKIAISFGYELVWPDFSGLVWSKEALKDPVRMEEILNVCIGRAEAACQAKNITADDKLLFLSKSIGTVVAAAYANQQGLPAKQIFFTPLPDMERFVEAGNGLVFYGSADPYALPETIERLCHEKQLEAYRIDNANHSLETGRVLQDIAALEEIMQRVEKRIEDTEWCSEEAGKTTVVSERIGECDKTTETDRKGNTSC